MASRLGTTRVKPARMALMFPDGKASGLACTRATIIWFMLIPLSGRRRPATAHRVSPLRTQAGLPDRSGEAVGRGAAAGLAARAGAAAATGAGAARRPPLTSAGIWS